MRDQISPSAVAGDLDRIEQLVLGLLLDTVPPGPWSCAEIGRALDSQLAADDALLGLHAAGLIHRCHDLVFPSRAAVRCRQLADAL
jgi:hypothetical protein